MARERVSIPPAMQRLGSALKQLRQARGVSLRTVAEACGLTAGHLAKIEGGATYKTIGLSVCVRLAKYFEVPLPILLREAGFIEEAEDELPDFATYLRRKYQLSSAAIHDLELAKELVERKYAPARPLRSRHPPVP